MLTAVEIDGPRNITYVIKGFKVNLHSIRVSSVFFTFFLRHKKHAVFHPHFYNSIAALSKLFHIDKNFA